MTAMATKQQDDPAAHKGAVEGDTATDEQVGNAHGDGVNEEGLPDDPAAAGSATDKLTVTLVMEIISRTSGGF